LGVDLNLGDYDKRTPLHVAAASGQVKIVLWLIEEANVLNSPVDRWGATPLNDA
jgi:glutaminase